MKTHLMRRTKIGKSTIDRYSSVNIAVCSPISFRMNELLCVFFRLFKNVSRKMSAAFKTFSFSGLLRAIRV